MRKIVMLLIFACYSNLSNAQEGESGQYQLFKSKTFVKNPLDLRDPFKRKITKKKSTQEKNQASMSGNYSNFNQNLDGLPIENLMVTGVIIGDERRAIVKLPNEKGEFTSYYIKEGMRIGMNNAEVKAILPGGIVLVEKIRNVYDLDEYLETVIPVSNK
ncbi:MAG: hypothetical protein HOP07_10860 [Bacteriovoracaceae bacterium]|nr:hypothetical protein [Bacteriovoracaceae bacterium]